MSKDIQIVKYNCLQEHKISEMCLNIEATELMDKWAIAMDYLVKELMI